MAKASLVLGILAAILGILMFVSPWFLLLSWLAWILLVVGLVLGIVALVQKKDKGVGLIINIVAGILVWLGGSHAANKAVDALNEAGTAAAIEEFAKAAEESAIATEEAAAATEEAAAATEEAAAATEEVAAEKAE